MANTPILDQIVQQLATFPKPFSFNAYADLFSQSSSNNDTKSASAIIQSDNVSTSSPIVDGVSFISQTTSNNDQFIMLNDDKNSFGNYNHIQDDYKFTMGESISPTSSISNQVNNSNLLNSANELLASVNLTNTNDSMKINFSSLPNYSTPIDGSNFSNQILFTEEPYLLDQDGNLNNLVDSCEDPKAKMAALNDKWRIDLFNKVNAIKNQIEKNNLANQIKRNNSLSNSINWSSNEDLNYFANGTGCRSFAREFNYNMNGGRNYGTIGESRSLNGNSLPKNDFDYFKSQPTWETLSPSKTVDYDIFKNSLSAAQQADSNSLDSSNRLDARFSVCSSQSKLFDYLIPTSSNNSSQSSTQKKSYTSSISSKISSPSESFNNVSHSSLASSTTSLSWGNEQLLETILEHMFNAINPNDPAQQKFLEQRNSLLEDISKEFKAKLKKTMVNGRTLQYPIWQGKFSYRMVQNPTYSRKVFLGGIPFDVEPMIPEIFKEYGKVLVHKPKDSNPRKPCGHLYASFESEDAIKKFLSDCDKKIEEDGKLKYFTSLSSLAWKSKSVEVKPWILENSTWKSMDLDERDYTSPNKTVFIGGLHGTMTAEHVVEVMEKVFGEVVFVSFDLDRNKYPGGSCRVSFKSIKSYILAVLAEYVDVSTDGWNKRLQINPYVHNSLCAFCTQKVGSIFCCDLACLRFHCQGCFNKTHVNKTNHRYIVKKSNESNRQ